MVACPVTTRAFVAAHASKPNTICTVLKKRLTVRDMVDLHRDGKKVTRQFFGFELRFSTTDCTRPVTLTPPTNVSVMMVPAWQARRHRSAWSLSSV
jgi:hypothetical protein